MPGKRARGERVPTGARPITDRADDHSHNQATPRFCLRHLHADYDVHSLSKDRRAAFAVALQKRAAMTWSEILRSHRHKLGPENMPASAIKAPIPVAFRNREQFMVLRYDGLLPMAGVRVGDTYHVLWIEPEFGRLYDHS